MKTPEGRARKLKAIKEILKLKLKCHYCKRKKATGFFKTKACCDDCYKELRLKNKYTRKYGDDY